MKRLMTKTLLDTMLEVRAKCISIRGFRRDEEGAMIIFSLFMFVLILTLAGMGVDLMRFETTRAKLQGTLNRATLAAADLDQTLPARQICEDYFAKAGILQYLDDDACTPPNEGINYRIVSASASVDMPMFFVDLPRVFTNPFTPGVSTLTVSGTSTAEERVTDVEISLVLDVSSSMNDNDRIVNLRRAAKEFVTAVMANNTNAPEGLITVSIVPYSAVVNPGTAISPFMTGINRTHDYSTCPLFDDDMFESTALDLSGNYDHVSHFSFEQTWCYTGDNNAVFPVSTNETKMHEAIDALAPYGNTAIDMGMKWGVALLDPSTRSMITSLSGSTAANVPAVANGRPEDLGRTDVLKIVVLMTDGENTQQRDLLSRFKTGLSYVWFDPQYVGQALNTVPFNEISVQYLGLATPEDFSDDRFYWNGFNQFNRLQAYPNGFSSQQDYVATRTATANELRTPGSGITYDNNVHTASWQDLYAGWEQGDVNFQLLRNARDHGAIPNFAGTVDYIYSSTGLFERIYLDDYFDADNAVDFDIVDGNEADDRLSDICQTARDEGIIVYTVAFEAPDDGQAALQDCATEGHYFNVSGTDISDAFSTISSNIRNLKLTR